jgi:hypothetical protein
MTDDDGRWQMMMADDRHGRQLADSFWIIAA